MVKVFIHASVLTLNHIRKTAVQKRGGRVRQTLVIYRISFAAPSIKKKERGRKKESFLILDLSFSSFHAINVILSFFSGSVSLKHGCIWLTATLEHTLSESISFTCFCAWAECCGHSLVAGERWLCGICRAHKGLTYCIVWEYGFRHS